MRNSRSLIRVWGRRRLHRIIDWTSLILVCAALGTAGLVFGLEPLLRSRAGIGDEGLLLVRAHAAAQALLFLIVGWLIWRRAVAAPLAVLYRELRSRLRRQHTAGRTRERALSDTADKRAGQLNALLQLNRGMRDKLARAGNDQQSVLRSRDALLNMMQDAVLLTDAAGVVTGVSPATATLLRSPRESLIGKRFEDVAPLFQNGADQFREFPLRKFLARILESGSAIPQIQQAVLVNHENEPVPVFVTAAAVLDAGKVVSGCTVRFSRADSPAPEQTTRPQLSLAEAEMNDWGTKLLSREPFERRLDELLAEVKATGAQHMLLYVRVDDLDRINDESGYWAGEQALWHAAKNFSQALLDSGTGYRYSNSRFAALLIGYDETRALELAERIRRHAEAQDLTWEGHRIPCRFSIAVLSIDRDAADRPSLLASAEALLAEAKNRGGNRTLQRKSEEALTQRRREDQGWLDWLGPRLRDGRAHLISQELRSLAEPPGAPLVEFFIRVEDDDGIWLEPGYFLPALERLRQSQIVDLWTLQNLLDALAKTPRVLETHAVASLNLSWQTLLDTAFAPAAFELLASSSIPAERLCFEIDEAFAVSQSSVVQRFMEQLRPVGVRFALDRCHTTMGLTQLRHLPVDYMKIHPSITRSIETEPLDRMQLEWICRAAHLLGRRTAAINIESENALGLLRSAGVDYVQGSAVNKIGPLMT